MYFKHYHGVDQLWVTEIFLFMPVLEANPSSALTESEKNSPVAVAMRYVTLPTAMQAEARLVHECYVRRERHMSRLNQSIYRKLWHMYFAYTGKRRVKACMVLKQSCDTLCALLLLLMLSPLLFIITAVILISSPGPIFYKSVRVGRYGKPFYMLKFRTMVVNADSMRANLRQDTDQQGQLFKLKHDPRIIPMGHILRKYSLDELPQLLNVVLGDMSLVGPRPFAPDDARLFEDPYTLRFEAIPGMTGLWQVSGRSNLNFRQLCKLDLAYTLEWSLLKDIKILFRTIPVVFGKVGAF
jgi:lipopolysaccharide/colanic/teichoic acid biosynthesis glycosyltransferase